MSRSNDEAREARQHGQGFLDVPLLSEIREEIAQLSTASIMERLTDAPTSAPSFAIDRLVREVALQHPRHGRLAIRRDITALTTTLINVLDERLVNAIGGDFPEVVLGRLMASQLLTQRDFTFEHVRAIALLSDDQSQSLLGPSAWQGRLGVDLPQFVLGLWGLAGLLEQGPVDVARLRVEAGEPAEAVDYMQAAVNLLTADLDRLHQVARKQGRGRNPIDAVYTLGPLTEVPIYLREDGRIAAPSIEYLKLAATVPALYIRLIREDAAEQTRARSKLVGERLHDYLLTYLSAHVDGGWHVRNLDDESADGRIADIAVWPDDGSFIMIVEAKATLQAYEAQLGNVGPRERMADLYQRSFDQIDATVERIGQDAFLMHAPKDVPVFGFTATLDRHLTTVVGGRTFLGLPLPYAEPTGPSAGFQHPVRVISVDDFESLIDLFAWCDAEDLLVALLALFDMGDTLNVRGVIRSWLPDPPSIARPVNPVIVETFERLASSVSDATFAAHLRRMARTLCEP